MPKSALLHRVVPILLALALTPAHAPASDLVIGTGSREGVYYSVGRALCRLLDRTAQAPACTSLPTAGSISNLEALRSGTLQLGIVQSDWQHHAVQGTGPFAAQGPDDGLRALFSLHAEPFTVVARRDAGVRRIQDLPGKRVNIGNPGSGQRATMEVVMQAFGWTPDVFALANELPASQQSLALCHDRVQAMVYTVGHPNASVAQATSLCDALLVDVQGPEIDALVAGAPFYAQVQIPGGIYPGNLEPVATFGVKATVVAQAALPADTVYELVKAVFDNLDQLRAMHPALGQLEASTMTHDGLSAPLHAGAIRYYRQRGLQ